MTPRSAAAIGGLVYVLSAGTAVGQDLLAVGSFAVGLGLQDAIRKCGFAPNDAQRAALDRKVAGLREQFAAVPGFEATVRENLPPDPYPCEGRAAFEQALNDYAGLAPVAAATAAPPPSAAPAPPVKAVQAPATPPPPAAPAPQPPSVPAPKATDLQAAIAGAIAATKAKPPKSARELMVQGMLIEVGADLCEVELDEDDAEQLGQAVHYLRGKAGLRRTQMDDAKEALETTAKKNKRAFCADFKRDYEADLKETLAAAE